MFSLTSCYEFSPLPERITSYYEIAIPMMDTTVLVGDFVYVKESSLEKDIPEGFPINMGEISYPFYIGDFGEAQTIKWIEPQITVLSKDLPAGTIATVYIYLKYEDGSRKYFWEPEFTEKGYPVTVTNTPTKVPDVLKRLTNIPDFRDNREIFLNLTLTYPAPVKASTALQHSLSCKLGIKFGMDANFKIDL
jgi:hypothetical protein